MDGTQAWALGDLFAWVVGIAVMLIGVKLIMMTGFRPFASGESTSGRRNQVLYAIILSLLAAGLLGIPGTRLKFPGIAWLGDKLLWGTVEDASRTRTHDLLNEISYTGIEAIMEGMYGQTDVADGEFGDMARSPSSSSSDSGSDAGPSSLDNGFSDSDSQWGQYVSTPIPPPTAIPPTATPETRWEPASSNPLQAWRDAFEKDRLGVVRESDKVTTARIPRFALCTVTKEPGYTDKMWTRGDASKQIWEMTCEVLTEFESGKGYGTVTLTVSGLFLVKLGSAQMGAVIYGTGDNEPYMRAVDVWQPGHGPSFNVGQNRVRIVSPSPNQTSRSPVILRVAADPGDGMRVTASLKVENSAPLASTTLDQVAGNEWQGRLDFSNLSGLKLTGRKKATITVAITDTETGSPVDSDSVTIYIQQ